jgi:glycosyltransferase involved in cell wall biosynthesis
VVVPTLGDPARLGRLLDALERQTLERSRWELVVAADTPSLDPTIERRITSFGGGARVARAGGGPGAARNRGAEAARGEWLAFTEDDCSPAPDWLERAAEMLAAHPDAEVLTGSTFKPGGRPVHRQQGEFPLYLPTNLFVRGDVYRRAGGYCEDYFDPASRVYFREDSDFGFALEEMAARIVPVPAARVEHPDEHPGFWDPVRWARRHLMDPLLAARHPRRFREAIEVHRLGPLRIRRPIVRMCLAFVVAILAAAVATLCGALVVGGELGLVALAALSVIWAKWQFDPRRLPILPIVPFMVVFSLIQGHRRAEHIMRRAAEPRGARDSAR